MDTLLLELQNWDLCLNASGNIAMATGAYALAQDAASACRLFLAELYLDTTQGIPYDQEILDLSPPIALIKARLVQAALTVPGIVTAEVFLTSIVNRELLGQVQITDGLGNTAAASIGP